MIKVKILKENREGNLVKQLGRFPKSEIREELGRVLMRYGRNNMLDEVDDIIKKYGDSVLNQDSSYYDEVEEFFFYNFL